VFATLEAKNQSTETAHANLIFSKTFNQDGLKGLTKEAHREADME
jgi:hypothetical protein